MTHETGKNTLVLTLCCKEKLDVAAPARQLYLGQLFRLVRQYAEANHFDWRILSAKYGLVTPDQVLEPYDVQITGRAQIGPLQKTVLPALAQIWNNYAKIIIIMGSQYLKVINPILMRQGDWKLNPGVKVEVIRDSRGIGGLLQKVKWMIAGKPDLAETPCSQCGVAGKLRLLSHCITCDNCHQVHEQLGPEPEPAQSKPTILPLPEKPTEQQSQYGHLCGGCDQPIAPGTKNIVRDPHTGQYFHPEHYNLEPPAGNPVPTCPRCNLPITEHNYTNISKCQCNENQPKEGTKQQPTPQPANPSEEKIEEFSRGGFKTKNAAIGYYGGKFNAVPGLLQYFPAPHSNFTFVEVFCGSAVVALNYHATLNILNDRDADLVNYFWVLHGTRYLDLLKKYPTHKNAPLWQYRAGLFEEFEYECECMLKSPVIDAELGTRGDPVGHALRYYLRNRNNFSNIPKDGFDYIQPRRKPTGEKHYKYFAQFLRDTETKIWNLDFKEVIARAREWEQTKLNEIFLYLDPPYMQEQGYVIKFTKADLRDLAGLLSFYPHHWIMSNEDSKLVRRYFGYYFVKKVRWAYTATVKCSTNGRHELLISNRPFVKRNLRQSNTLDEYRKEVRNNDQ